MAGSPRMWSVVWTLFCSLTLCLPSFFTLSPYAPTVAQCPSSPLIRSAEGLSTGEKFYRTRRDRATSGAFKSFLLNQNKRLPSNDTFRFQKAPIIALASSGGKIRALLAGAGVVQAMDLRDSGNGDDGLKGLYQALTYHSGVDGGAWLVSALAGNNNQTISDLYFSLWEGSFPTATFLPSHITPGQAYASIALNLAAKELNGFQSTLADSLGGLLSFHLLNNTAKMPKTLSGILRDPMFTSFQAPYPIITALKSDMDIDHKGCDQIDNRSLRFEFHPYETGTWEPGHRVFAQTPFLGTPLTNGVPLAHSICLRGFDNLALVIAISSNAFYRFCSVVPRTNLLTGEWGDMENDLIGLVGTLHQPTFLDEYGIIPNPFFQSKLAPGLAASENLYLVDGTSARENIPLWPLIQPERQVDAIIVNDNSDDTSEGYPDGSSLYNAYTRSREIGLLTMPPIPQPAIFQMLGLNRKPTFFGCYDPSAITIIYLPNVAYTVPSNASSYNLSWTSRDVVDMILNGNNVATRGNDTDWPRCLTCGLLLRVNQGKLPAHCAPCLEKYCWPRPEALTNSGRGPPVKQDNTGV